MDAGRQLDARPAVHARTPGMLLGWIPVVSLLFRTRPVVLLFPGVRELQDVDIAIAVTAIVITLVLVIGGIVGPASPPDQIPPGLCSPLCRLLP